MVAQPTTQPLVVVFCRVPLVCEAIAATLDGIADVRSFPAQRADLAGLLEWLRPDAIVVDSEADGQAAIPFARAEAAPLVLLKVQDATLRVLDGSDWQTQSWSFTPETLRNVLVGGIFGRGKSA